MLLSFLTSFFFLSPALADAPDSARIEILTDHAAVVAQYCRVETGAHFDDCAAPRDKGLAVIYFPLAAGEKIAGVVNQALQLGYARELSKTDLFHGHMILKGPQTEYPSAEAFVADLQVSLFHSEEYTSRWYREGQQGLSIEQRTPRSFVGWPSGLLQKAIDLIVPGSRLKSYANAGTIYTEELWESNAALSAHKLSNFGGYEPLFVQAGTQRCQAEAYYYILQDPAGRFYTDKGQAFEIFSHCTFPLK